MNHDKGVVILYLVGDDITIIQDVTYKENLLLFINSIKKDIMSDVTMSITISIIHNDNYYHIDLGTY